MKHERIVLGGSKGLKIGTCVCESRVAGCKEGKVPRRCCVERLDEALIPTVSRNHAPCSFTYQPVLEALQRAY